MGLTTYLCRQPEHDCPRLPALLLHARKHATKLLAELHPDQTRHQLLPQRAVLVFTRLQWNKDGSFGKQRGTLTGINSDLSIPSTPLGSPWALSRCRSGPAAQLPGPQVAAGVGRPPGAAGTHLVEPG
jgi:hypothetical protein